ncbi:MAG: chaperone modulator CbpM [Saprospiraceae bacterium]
MDKENLIEVSILCNSHNVETSFIHTLQSRGILEVITIDTTEFVEESSLRELEQIIRFHYEMDINLEGIETIMHLLQAGEWFTRRDTRLKEQGCFFMKNKIQILRYMIEVMIN